MRLWMVRAGRFGETESINLEKGLLIIGFVEVTDLANCQSREDITEVVQVTYPEDNVNRVNNFAGQLHAFVNRIEPGDLVVLPLKSKPQVAIGRITGSYRYHDINGQHRHTRPVEWLQTDIPRDRFKQDLLYSFGAFMTVCQISRNNALARVQAVLKGKPDPGPVAADAKKKLSKGKAPTIDETEANEANSRINLDEFARDQIRQHIGSQFAGHGLARLVEAVLQIEGYHTELSPPGPDGGIDILGGRGSLGFDDPRLCVQVKSGDTPVDLDIFQRLLGTMQNCGAGQGLLVSWAGFKSSINTDAKRNFFNIRLWDANQVLDAVLRVYDRLPAEIQSELPLKRTWTLVLEDDG